MHEQLPGESELRRMKLIAVGLLLAAVLLLVIARTRHSDPTSWGYIEAFAEAAIVGALADWFAVTALFRHPLRIPIPHTAIIPRRKDQIARSLGEFFERNFLSREIIRDRLAGARIGSRLGHWLAEPTHAARAADSVADAIHASVSLLDDSDVRVGLERAIEQRIEHTPVAPIAARAIELATEGGHHQRLLDSALRASRGFLADNKESLRARVGEESPWWVPTTIDNRVFAKLYDGVERLLAEVEADPDHHLRRSFEQRLARFAEHLRTDSELRSKGEQLKHELLDHPDLRGWIGSLWDDAKGQLIEASGRPGSEFRVRIAATLAQVGERVRDEPELQARLDHAVEQIVAYVVENYRHEVTALIETTVAKWDGESTSRRIELQVGRDLQFIRINGTVVGGLAGLVIHALTVAVF